MKSRLEFVRLLDSDYAEIFFVFIRNSLVGFIQTTLKKLYCLESLEIGRLCSE